MLGRVQGNIQRSRAVQDLEGIRPPGPCRSQGDVFICEGRARERGGPIDVNQQRAKSSFRQMASKGLAVKALRVQSQADDFLGQIIENRITELWRLLRIQVVV